MKSKVKYIFSEGELKRKDNSLCFRKENKNVYIPVEEIEEIYLMGNANFNVKLLDFVGRNSIPIHMFNYYGSYSGTYYPKEKYLSGKLLYKQVKALDEKRIAIARNIVGGIAKNISEVMYHYYRHDRKNLKETINYLNDEVPKKLFEASSIKEIMGIEGNVWNLFYKEIDSIVLDFDEFTKRVKRPPNNPINAMISFGNTMLYTKCITQIYHTHLNQSISFLHEPQKQRFSLALDISEVFKPVLVFKTIFSLINKKQIKVEKHFVKDVNYCMLNEEGRKIFIKEFETRLNQTFEHKTLKRKTSYLNAIKLDAYKLIKTIVEEEEFEPFCLKELV